jgi:glutaconate CoA-transferase, subunit A
MGAVPTRRLRDELGDKLRPVADKLVPVETAVRLVTDGDHLAIGGTLYSRTPMVLLFELLRQGRAGLTLSRPLTCYEAELFLVAGAARGIVTSWVGIGLPWGISRVMRHYVESGEVRFEEWSHLGLGLRYRAAAMGVPFLPTLTMLGSDLMGVSEAQAMTCPFTGETVNLVPALFPDVAILHVHRADRFGNCQIDGYTHMDADLARAATTVLVTAEEIVDEEVFRANPDRTVIPGFVVDAVVHAPLGAFPGECYGLYETDFSHFDDYVAGINAKGMDGVRDYLERYVYGPTSHPQYVALFEPALIARQQQAARELVNPRLHGV